MFADCLSISVSANVSFNIERGSSLMLLKCGAEFCDACANGCAVTFPIARMVLPAARLPHLRCSSSQARSLHTHLVYYVLANLVGRSRQQRALSCGVCSGCPSATTQTQEGGGQDGVCIDVVNHKPLCIPQSRPVSPLAPMPTAMWTYFLLA